MYLRRARVAEARSQPWLYYVTAAAAIGPRLAVYAGYARGLEERGIAPDVATNSNQPLPAILTSQRDAGVRYVMTDTITLVAGVFDLRKPYYDLDAVGRVDPLGDIVSRGVEVSAAGAGSSPWVATGNVPRRIVTPDEYPLDLIGNDRSGLIRARQEQLDEDAVAVCPHSWSRTGLTRAVA